MASHQPPKPLPDPGSIDFEETDFDSARQALDELPPGVVMDSRQASVSKT